MKLRYLAAVMLAGLLTLLPSAHAQTKAWTSSDGIVGMAIPEGWAVIKNPKYTLFIERVGDQAGDWADCRLIVASLPNLGGESQTQLNARMEQRPTEPLTRGGSDLLEYSTAMRIGKAMVREYTTKNPDSTLRGRELAVATGSSLAGIAAICTSSNEAPKARGDQATEFLNSLTVNIKTN